MMPQYMKLRETKTYGGALILHIATHPCLFGRGVKNVTLSLSKLPGKAPQVRFPSRAQEL